MARALHKTHSVTPRGSRGFTLIEMMIVVAIVGILATLAVVGYRKLIQSSHVSEATGMVQNIRVAQEGYHSETQQYANVSINLSSYYPLNPPSSDGHCVGGSMQCLQCRLLVCFARSRRRARHLRVRDGLRDRRHCARSAHKSVRRRVSDRVPDDVDDRLVRHRSRRGPRWQRHRARQHSYRWRLVVEPAHRRQRGAITTFNQGNQERNQCVQCVQLSVHPNEGLRSSS